MAYLRVRLRVSVFGIRQATVYAILPPKGELKMKKADPSERAGCRADREAVPATPGATAAYTCVNIEGGWNFTVAWTGRGVLEGRGEDGAAAGGGGAALDPTGRLNVFQAIERQLGLKVEKGTHALTVTVIDHVEQKPTD